MRATDPRAPEPRGALAGLRRRGDRFRGQRSQPMYAGPQGSGAGRLRGGLGRDRVVAARSVGRLDGGAESRPGPERDLHLDERSPGGAGRSWPTQGADRGRIRRRSRGLGSRRGGRGRGRAAPLSPQGLALRWPPTLGPRRGDVSPGPTGLRWERSSRRPSRRADSRPGHPRMSSSSNSPAATFPGLVDLAAATLGGRVLGTSDEFFAEANGLLQSGRAVFVEGKFTDRGKWMDGWESRRRRGDGHDWGVLALGVPGEVVGFDIDTQHFVGNPPPFASVDGLWAPDAAEKD